MYWSSAWYNKRLLHDISISALVSDRDSHIKSDSEAGGLIPGTIWKIWCHNLLSHILHRLFSLIDFYIAEKIFEVTNCKNKSWRELPLFNCQICLFRVWFQNGIKKNVDMYNDVRKCLQNRPKTLTCEWKFLFNTTYTFEPIIPF